MPAETDLEMADRHIFEGDAAIARQHRLIARLLLLDVDPDLAERILDNLCLAQQNRIGHRERMIVASARPSA